MPNAGVILKGIVHGRMIELEREPGLPDGQSVAVTIQPTLLPGQGLRRAFGAWPDDTNELDEFVRQAQADREADPRTGRQS